MHAHATAHKMETCLQRFCVRKYRFHIGAPVISFRSIYLRRPPPPLRPPPPRLKPPPPRLKPPPREPPPPRLKPPLPRDRMLEEPRLLLLRALDPLNPLEPPPKAFWLPAPPRERLRPPMRSAPPAPAARFALPATPARLPGPAFPPKPPKPPPAAGLLLSFPPCRAICCRAPAWR